VGYHCVEEDVLNGNIIHVSDKKIIISLYKIYHCLYRKEIKDLWKFDKKIENSI
jgi:hypothetical protein